MYRHPFLFLLGAIEGLLLARLVARLLAARPDSPAFNLLFNLTTPLVAPLELLDQYQPRFGAVLELSTLVVGVGVALLAGLVKVIANSRYRQAS
ncbi:YggT family protein [Candidatus Oscillochloris fontis]|uniref:YggT family protein n=1 Tax=Candidatus Oscillochloris fontis TaxID=2496868 RepID=UPI00101D88CB|nr:YggT family protein [Candidatus Oscillochloris fontis]